MNATEYAKMVETGVAPCGCPHRRTQTPGGERSWVEHTEDCDERSWSDKRREESARANATAAAARQHRGMVKARIQAMTPDEFARFETLLASDLTVTRAEFDELAAAVKRLTSAAKPATKGRGDDGS